jgi:glycosyltransferase involved in cell wall biosynthesis/SAM-dependent methyltransferase
MVILTFTNFYLPGCKGGGPIQSVANMAALLGENFQFKVITTDRDHKDAKPYPGIKLGEWQQVGRARVLYVSPGDLSFWKLWGILNNTDYDVLYLNSFFHPHFTIRPLLLWWGGMVRPTPVVIAPRGEFSPGALAIKRFKKHLYLVTVRCLGLYDRVLWHASSSYEKTDIRNRLGRKAVVNQAPVIVAPDLISVTSLEQVRHPRKKERGHLSIVFASRISPKKNLTGALRCLTGLRGTVEFEIFGHVDNDAYWKECQQMMRDLPSNVHVRYRGVLSHEDITREMAQHDLFFLPTLGENFGHVIVESLSAGCPVLISNQTPWRDLAPQSAGWDLSIGNLYAFQHVLQQCLDMDEQEHAKWRAGARSMAETFALDDSSLLMNRVLFLKACQDGCDSNPTATRDLANDMANEQQIHFDSLANSWEKKYETGGSMSERPAAFVQCLRENLGTSGCVLDFGCGAGNITIACQEAGYLMHGVDSSQCMVDRAHIRFSCRGIEFKCIETGEPLTLPYSKESFGAVIASSVLEYVKNPLDCFQELWRVCAPDGLLILTVPNVLHPQRWLETALGRVLVPGLFSAGNRWQLYAEYLKLSRNRLRLKDWSQLLRAAGWELQKIQGRDTTLIMLVAKRVGVPQMRLVSNEVPACH